MVEHRGMLNHLHAKLQDLKLTAADAVAQTASQCFDISVWQFLVALLVGGRTRIFPDEVAHVPARLLEGVEQRADVHPGDGAVSAPGHAGRGGRAGRGAGPRWRRCGG